MGLIPVECGRWASRVVFRVQPRLFGGHMTASVCAAAAGSTTSRRFKGDGDARSSLLQPPFTLTIKNGYSFCNRFVTGERGLEAGRDDTTSWTGLLGNRKLTVIDCGTQRSYHAKNGG